MSAEWKPPEDQGVVGRFITSLTRLTLRFPVATIAVGVALAAAALGLTATRMGYRTSRLDLLNPESDYNRLWIDYIEEFGDQDDAVVVVEGPSREHVVPVLQEISTLLAREDKLFQAVLHEVDLSAIRSKGLHYLSEPELLGLERFLSELEPTVRGNWTRLNLGNMTVGMCARLAREPRPPAGATPAEIEIQRLSGSLLASLTARGAYHSPWPEMPHSFATLSELSSEYLLTSEGRLGFVLLRLARGKDSFARGTEATNALRELIAAVSARHPETKIGLTGLPIMENDEMRASQSSMFWAGLLSLIGVSLLFVAGFGGVRHALVANLVLLLGMAWAFGYVTLSVGHLNIFSVSFAVTLIGIGIDYAVYYVARYFQVRAGGVRSPTEALLRTSAQVGPAITTGAVTTAISFFAAGFTNFTGVSELGIIAGGGILLCLAAQLFVLPAAIALMDGRCFTQRMPTPLPVHTWIQPLMRAPRLVLSVTVCLALVISCGMSRLWYDHNLLNMQPQGLESVELERKLLAQCNQSMWYALSVANSREELLSRKAEFLKLPSVERTEEIVSLLPADHDAKRAVIERIHRRLAQLPERPPMIPVDAPEGLGQVLAHAQQLLADRGVASRCQRELEAVRDVLRRMPQTECFTWLGEFQQQMAGDLLSRLHMLRNMANPEPPHLSDLPQSLVTRFVGQHGRHLLKIYGRGNIWDMAALSRFVKDVRSVDPRATGNPLQAYEASLEMKRSYEQSALYALGVILIVLMIDFRSVWFALLAAAPLCVGVAQMFGLMGLLNIPLNPANMIGLPLILGIGVDYGVHIIHDFREQRGRYRISPSTAVAVMVDALTTIVGYGSLMVASHQGLQSMGRVLTLGVTCCLFTSIIMLPALLTWLTRHRPEVEDESSTNKRRSLLESGVLDRQYRRQDDPHHTAPEPHSARKVAASRREP